MKQNCFKCFFCCIGIGNAVSSIQFDATIGGLGLTEGHTQHKQGTKVVPLTEGTCCPIFDLTEPEDRGGNGTFFFNIRGFNKTIEKCCSGQNAQCSFNKRKVLINMVSTMDHKPGYDATILWMLEQITSSWSKKQSFLNFVNNVSAIWGSKSQQMQWEPLLRRPNVPTRPFHNIPYWHTLDYDYFSYPKHHIPTEQRKYGFLLFGYMRERRQAFVLKALGQGVKIESVNFDKTNQTEYFEYVANAKVIVNVHFYDSAFLEVHRINPVLAMGLTVFSETSADAELDAQYKDIVDLSPNQDELIQKLKQCQSNWVACLKPPQTVSDWIHNKMTSTAREMCSVLKGL